MEQVKTVSGAIKGGWSELIDSFKYRHVFLIMGWQDIATRYRRSAIGAFWLTLNITILICALGIIFGTIFQSSIKDFLPSVMLGLVLWSLMSNVLSESCDGFIASRETITHIRLPLLIHVWRVIVRQMIIFCHNILIIPLAFIFFSQPVNLYSLWAVIGLALVVTNLCWMSIIFAVICARFRDINEIVRNALQVIFYGTPIIWTVEVLPDRFHDGILNLNIFYHFISIVRSPLLGMPTTPLNWLIPIFVMPIGWTCAFIFLNKYKNRIPYWL